jgi:hypothetical protein
MDDKKLEKWVRERMYDPHRESEIAEAELKDLVGPSTKEVDKAHSHL